MGCTNPANSKFYAVIMFDFKVWAAKNPDSWDFMILWVNIAIADIRAHLHIWNDVKKK